jgi:hypothetical protein
MWSGAVVCPASKMRLSKGRGPVWRYANRDHFAHPRSMAHRPECWFAGSGLVTVCPYVSSRPAHILDVNPAVLAYAAAIAESR